MKFRQASYDDFPFIVNSWAASMADSDLGRSLDPRVFKVEIRARINRLIETSHNVVLEDEGKIAGFICVNRDHPKFRVLHFVYVAKAYRRQGVCAQLIHLTLPLEGGMIWATHKRANFKYLATKYLLIYNPFLLEAMPNE
jgi:hypothetical protein